MSAVSERTRARPGGGICLLVVHRVVDQAVRDHDTSWASFRELLEALQTGVRRFTTDPVSEVGSTPGLALTFDDGSGDHLAIGETLAGRGIRGIFFVSARLVGQPGYLDEVARITGGRGADLILEMLANKNLGKDLTVLAKKGRVVVIGSRGPVEINPRDAMGRDASILAMSSFNTSPEELRGIHAALTAGLANGALNPVIGRQFSLAEAQRAHEAVMEPGAYGKIVLLP